MKTLLSCICGLLLSAASLPAPVLFSDDFNYPNGPLLGQGGGAGQGVWTITGTSVVNPLAVAGATVTLAATGQDAYSALPGGTYNLADGNSFYMGLDMSVASVAAATGDYFLHWSTTVGNTSIFPDRLYVKGSGTGYVLGWAPSSGTGISWGSTVLTYNNSYRVVTEYDAVAGSGNDTGAIFVNGGSYVSGAFAGTGTEPPSPPETIAEICLRQGSSGPLVTIDNLNAATTFGEVNTFTPIPEPATAVLGGLALLALAVFRRRS
jgi:hypothetical protein